MDDNLRACVAYIAAGISGTKTSGSVYDHARGKHILISGTVSDNSVAVYDHSRGAHISGTPPALYDHSLGAHVSLNVQGSQFNGYDHKSSSHYNGTISGNAIAVYDFKAGKHFHYGV